MAITIKRNAERPEPEEVIAEAIIQISKGMAEMRNSRLTRRAIVALLHDNSKVPKGTIEIVLNNLESLEATWLKKRTH